MPQPPTYLPVTDFSQDEANNVGGRSTVRTEQVDVELANIKTTLDALNTNIGLIQRDDGQPRDDTITAASLKDEAVNYVAGATATGAAWVHMGAWLTATAYLAGNVVEVAGSSYVAIVPHTSGTFATDLAAGKWRLIAATGSSTLPVQTGQASKFLRTDGTNAAWVDAIEPAELQSGSVLYGVATTGDNTNYAVTLTPALTTYTHAMRLSVLFPVTPNNANPTLSVNGLGAKNIFVNGSAVPAGLLTSGEAELLLDNVAGRFYVVGLALKTVLANSDNAFTGANTHSGAETFNGRLASDFVAGPASATDNAVALYNGTGGKTVKDGPAYSTAATANALAQRDASGDIIAAHFKAVADDIGAASPSRLAVETGSDNFYRWQTLANFKALLFSPQAISTERLIPAALTEEIFLHGLGRQPYFFTVVLRNFLAEHGYVAGNEVLLSNDHRDSSGTLSVFATSTEIGFNRDSSLITIISRSTGGSVNITNTSWRLVFRAW